MIAEDIWQVGLEVGQTSRTHLVLYGGASLLIASRHRNRDLKHCGIGTAADIMSAKRGEASAGFGHRRGLYLVQKEDGPRDRLGASAQEKSFRTFDSWAAVAQKHRLHRRLDRLLRAVRRVPITVP